MKTIRIAALGALLLLGACATSTNTADKQLEIVLLQYAKTMRWGALDGVIAFIDPETLERHPISTLERERLKQVQIASYKERKVERPDPEHATQVVELEIVNVNTQAVRSVLDHQTWRYDAKEKKWWLSSGLPKLAETP